MMILSTEADGEQHAEIISRVSTLIDEAGGTVDDVAEWGRRPIAYPVRKQTDGVYVIVTCQAEPAAIDEVCRILSISKEVVLRAMPFRLSPAEERPRGGRGGRGGGAAGGRRRDRDR